MARPRRTSYSDCYFGHTDTAMDAALWGELQSYIDLAMVYAKLPLAPFFRLRQVCKEWNRLASDREFLERTFKPPISDPFFVVTTPYSGDRLLSCQASSWSSMRVPPVKCAVSGLLYEFSEKDIQYGIRVFDLHTRVWHTLPPIPSTMQVPDDEEHWDDPMVGMTVDTTLIPHSFKVVLADQETGTRIYDSKSGAWTQKPSTYDRALIYLIPRPSCVNDNQFLYINAASGASMTFELHAYDLQKDEWNFEISHTFKGSKQEILEMGLWRERLFVIGLKFPVVAVWETDWLLEEWWTRFDSMPKELVAWISDGKSKNCEYIQSKFCNQYVLVYNYFASQEKAVLYNLDRKTWEKVELPGFVRPPRPRRQYRQ